MRNKDPKITTQVGEKTKAKLLATLHWDTGSSGKTQCSRPVAVRHREKGNVLGVGWVVVTCHPVEGFWVCFRIVKAPYSTLIVTLLRIPLKEP